MVQHGHVVASARTADGGRPHAEALALAAAGDAAAGCTAYVSLEPCSHDAATPPCVDALIDAGVSRVVIGCQDPNPHVAGRGISRLQASGIEVIPNILSDAAQQLIRGHHSRMRHDRPDVLLKIAASLDGGVATANRQRLQLTGTRAMALVSTLRAEVDGVLTGVGTVTVDDPMLLPRNPGLANRMPVRIVLDTRLSIAHESQLVRSASSAPLWIVHAPSAPITARAELERAGIQLIEVPADDCGVRLDIAMERLGELGVGTLLVEAGPTLTSALLAAQLVDGVIWLTAGCTLGNDGLRAIAGSHHNHLALRSIHRVGVDSLTEWEPEY